MRRAFGLTAHFQTYFTFFPYSFEHFFLFSPYFCFNHYGNTGSHCVLLKHYSVDFLWWFDRKICRLFSFFSMVIKKEKLVKWQELKTALCNLTKKCFHWILSACSSGLGFRSNLQMNLEAKSMHGSSWKKKSIVSEFTLFFVLFTVNGLVWLVC